MVHFLTHNNVMIHLEGYIQAEIILEIAIPIQKVLHCPVCIVIGCISHCLLFNPKLGYTNLNICFSDPAGSHFAEFQKKKKKKGCGQVLAIINAVYHAHKCCPT